MKSPIQFPSPVHFQPDDTFKSMDYTYSNSKYSCVAWVFPLHIGFAYLMVFSGLFAILSRVVDKLRPYHTTFGRWYVLSMLWCMACSLLISTNGFPFTIIISFSYMMIGTTFGWSAIKKYTHQLGKQVSKRVDIRIKNLFRNNKEQIDINIKQMEKEQAAEIISSKSFKQRIFSLKMLHGILMSFGWYQVASRLMFTNPLHFDGCWTYPAYKSNDFSKVYLVDSLSSPQFPLKDGPFIAIITFPTLLILLVVGCSVTYYYFKQDIKKGKIKNSNQSTITQKILAD